MKSMISFAVFTAFLVSIGSQVLAAENRASAADAQAVLNKIIQANKDLVVVKKEFGRYDVTIIPGHLIEIGSMKTESYQACGLGIHNNGEENRPVIALNFRNLADEIFADRRNEDTARYIEAMPPHLSSVATRLYVGGPIPNESYEIKDGSIQIHNDEEYGMHLLLEHRPDGTLIRATVLDQRSTLFPNGFRLVCEFEVPTA